MKKNEGVDPAKKKKREKRNKKEVQRSRVKRVRMEENVMEEAGEKIESEER